MKTNVHPLAAMALRTWLLTVALLAPSLQAQTIPNPSFEAQTFANAPGYASGNGGSITGWTFSGNVGLNPAGGQNPFADNGAIPQGTKVAFLQSAGNVPAEASTTITGLTAGEQYFIRFRVNARNFTAADNVAANWFLNGTLMSQLGIPVTPVGGSNPYLTVSAIYTAPAATAILSIKNQTAVDTTLLVDDFQIVSMAQAVVVTNTNDSGPGSLRWTLENAATIFGANAITFAPAIAGQKISLASTIIIEDAGGVTVDATGAPGIVIDDGTATSYGLFYIQPGGNFTFRGLTFANGGGANYTGSGGAITNNGTLTLERCTLSGNSTSISYLSALGGAIINNGYMTLTQCTLSGNTSRFGGAISSHNNITLTQCTLSGNSAAIGGAISNGGALTLTQCTLSGNSATTGGAISNGGTLTLANTIVAGNTDSAAGTSTDNMEGPFSGSNNVTDVDPKLAPLADNGGPTKTMALLPGSPALDAGSVLNPALPLDQRGFARNIDGDFEFGTRPDIGAYEAQARPVASIGFNFEGGINGNPATTGGKLSANEVAGVFPQANWNNLTNANDGVTHDGSAANAATLNDAAGNAISTLKLWWQAPNVWAVNTSVPGTPDGKLMNGYLDSNGSGDGSAATDLYASTAAQPFLAISGLPLELTRRGYRVLVYADGGNTSGVVASYWLNSNDGQNPSSTAGERRLTPSIFLSDTANFSGTYTPATGTSIGTATAGANYVRFDSQTNSAFTVRAEEHSFRATINAVQIVPNESISVTTIVDELDPPGTPGTGISLREALRDAPDGARIYFSALSGRTIVLSQALGDIILERNVTIDASNLAT